jgi:PncC family amidohydrolase
MKPAADLKKLQGIGKYLLRNRKTIAVAESVTAGLLQYKFSTIPDASKFFHGGITVFNIGQKFKHLQVEPLHALSVNCVSEKVAREMALNVCNLFASDWGIGITGYATPVPESENKIFAFYAISYQNKVKAAGRISSTQIDPHLVQEKYVDFIIQKLSTLI